jgi:hypothetical protein
MVRLDEERERCRDALDTARVEVADVERARWPWGDANTRTDAQIAAANAHDAVVRYVEAVRACVHNDRERLSDDVAGGHEFPDGATLPVTIADIDEWKDIRYQDQRPNSSIEAVNLPVAYGRELARKADRLAIEYGLLEEEPRRVDDEAET